MYQIWLHISNGSQIFVSQHPDLNDARWWLYAWQDRGFFPAQDSTGREVTIPRSGGQIVSAYLIESSATPPDQADLLDLITGTQ